MNTYQPEKLSLWDRVFNRYKTVPVEKGNENWHKAIYGSEVPNSKFVRSYVLYHKIDRSTGGFKIIKEYLN